MRNVHRVCTECSQDFVPNSKSRPLWTWCSFRCARKGWLEVAERYEGHCPVCNRAVLSVFCNKRCRSIAQAPSRVFLRCRFCAKHFEIYRSEWTRGGGAYCSHGCAGRNAAGEVQAKPIDDAFGHWLAGLVDGEGCFPITAYQRSGNTVHFSIQMRADEEPMLTTICNTLGYGKVYFASPTALAKNGQRVSPKAVFACTSVKACTEVARLFTKYPLRSKKARDFELWKTAVQGFNEGTIGHAEATRLRELLSAVRAYQ